MGYRILIVEDEFILANNLKALAEALRHTVVGIAGTGAQGMALAESEAPDLVLMDIKLPEVDGLTAAKAIIERQPIPVIIISAFSNRRYVEDAVKAGVMTYLIKPVTQGDLQAAIDLAMARHQEILALRQEVGDLKTALAQRKIIERAKGCLMDHLHLTEGEAFHRLQVQSQRENRTMVEIAQAVITTYSMLGDAESSTTP